MLSYIGARLSIRCRAWGDANHDDSIHVESGQLYDEAPRLHIPFHVCRLQYDQKRVNPTKHLSFTRAGSGGMLLQRCHSLTTVDDCIIDAPACELKTGSETSSLCLLRELLVLLLKLSLRVLSEAARIL